MCMYKESYESCKTCPDKYKCQDLKFDSDFENKFNKWLNLSH